MGVGGLMSAEVDRFVHAMRHAIDALTPLGYRITEPVQQGLVVRFSLVRSDSEIKLFYGPPEYHVEMTISMDYPSGRKIYELADLLREPGIGEWIRQHRPATQDDKLEAESIWFAELLALAVPKLTPSKR
jgi:hypothetical protein